MLRKYDICAFFCVLLRFSRTYLQLQQVNIGDYMFEIKYSPTLFCFYNFKRKSNFHNRILCGKKNAGNVILTKELIRRNKSEEKLKLAQLFKKKK